MDPFAMYLDESDLKREKRKARDLKQTQWWKRKISQGKCYYCGETFLPAEMTMDHVVPISRGGKTTKGNVVPSCKTCNTKKKQLLPMEWDAYLKSTGHTPDDLI